jgi:hypothetical protein
MRVTKTFENWKNAPVLEEDHRQIEQDQWERQLKELEQAAKELEELGVT